MDGRVRQFLQTESDLTYATLDVCEQLRRINVCYAEIRFCPTLHTHKGLTEEEALVAVKKGFELSHLDGGVIVCALRTFDEAHAMRMAKLAATGGAVGFDVAGYETGSPLTKIAAAIEYAVAQENLGVTVHAGEWVDQGNEGARVVVGGAQAYVPTHRGMHMVWSHLGIECIAHTCVFAVRFPPLARSKHDVGWGGPAHWC